MFRKKQNDIAQNKLQVRSPEQEMSNHRNDMRCRSTVRMISSLKCNMVWTVEACSCKPAPRGLPSSSVQLHTPLIYILKVRSWRTSRKWKLYSFSHGYLSLIDIETRGRRCGQTKIVEGRRYYMSRGELIAALGKKGNVHPDCRWLGWQHNNSIHSRGTYLRAGWRLQGLIHAIQ